MLTSMVSSGMRTNPYALARQSCGMTQKRLANLSSVTPQVITNLESGLFYKPPVSVQQTFQGLIGDEALSLPRAYRKWQRLERASHAEDVATRPIDQGWIAFRGESLRGFCRQIVYQPSMLQEYERLGRNRLSLNYALRDCGVSRDDRTVLLYR